jgi:hypothetical protein
VAWQDLSEQLRSSARKLDVAMTTLDSGKTQRAYNSVASERAGKARELGSSSRVWPHAERDKQLTS